MTDDPVDATAASATTYKVLGEIDADTGAGVIGRNTATTGTPIGVEGVVTDADGYGLSTPGDARVAGTADLSALGGPLTGGQTISDLLGDGLAVDSEALSAADARPDVDDGTTSVADADALTFGSGLTVDASGATATVRLDPSLSWYQGQILRADTERLRTWFGESVALDADASTALVGDPNKTGNEVPGKVSSFVNASGGWIQQSHFAGSNTANKDKFGFATDLSADGSTGVVGAPSWDGLDGYADVIDGSDWGSPTTLQTYKTSESTDEFGWSVAMDDDGAVAAIGAKLADGAEKDQGKVRVYDSGGDWANTSGATTTLTASNPSQDSLLGSSLAIDGTGSTVLAGAQGTASDEGKGYIFEESGGWSSVSTETATLTPDGTSNFRYGASAAIDSAGDLAFVGDRNAYTSVDNSGAVYVHDGSDGWDNATQVAELTASDATTGAEFGQSVAVDGDALTAAVGAPGATNASGVTTGAAYIFDGSDGWSNATETDKLVPVDSGDGNEVGAEVGYARDDDVAFVGAPRRKNSSGNITGAASSYYGVD